MCRIKAIDNEYVEGEEILFMGRQNYTNYDKVINEFKYNFKPLKIKHMNSLDELINHLDMKQEDVQEENKKIEKYDILKNEMYDQLMTELTNLFTTDDIYNKNSFYYYHNHFTNKYFRKVYNEGRCFTYVRKCNNEELLHSPIIKTKTYYPYQALERVIKNSITFKPTWYRYGIEIMNKTYKEMKVKELKELLKMNDPKVKISKMKKADLVRALMKL